MHFAFLDETGTGSAKTESHVIVGGVLAHADRQLGPVERHLSALWDRTIPAQHRPEFIFHASEFFGRRGAVFDKDTSEVSASDRKLIQESLADIPIKFDLPVVLQAVERGGSGHVPGRDGLLLSHVTAMSLCSLDIEHWMRKQGAGTCQLVVEDNDHARKTIALHHKNMCRPNIKSELDVQPEELSLIEHLLPYQRIRKAVLFEGKSSPSLLELADFCLYVARKVSRDENEAIFLPLLQAFWSQRVFAIR
jgi:hypothetical protein